MAMTGSALHETTVFFVFVALRLKGVEKAHSHSECM